METSNGRRVVHLLGRDWPVTLPDFATREELAIEHGRAGRQQRVLRVCAALVGACTGIGRKAGADYLEMECNALRYGGAVYGWLREQGVQPTELVEASNPLLALCADSLFPREAEVEQAAGFSGAPGEEPIASR